MKWRMGLGLGASDWALGIATGASLYFALVFLFPDLEWWRRALGFLALIVAINLYHIRWTEE